MKKVAACLALFLLAFSAHGLARKDRMVIVISLDGFPAYALDDPRLPIPTLRKLAHEGAIARAMQPINPTVTWPNHTTMVTGVNASEHRVLVNGLITHNADGTIAIEPWRDKDIMVHAPTVYDLAYKAGLTTAQVDWVAIYGAKTITWTFPEDPDPKGLIEGELVAAGLVTREQLARFDDSSPAWQDQIRTDAAVDILKHYKPNLMLLHLLSLDDTNHEYGPMSDASLQTMAFLDDRVKQVMDGVQNENATVLIVSDHGFRKLQHSIHANAALRDAGLRREVKGNAMWDAWVVPDGGAAMVYVTDPARRTELLPKLQSLFAGLEGVLSVYSQEEFTKLGIPLPGQSDQAPDLFISAKPGYGFSNGIEGNIINDSSGGTHGYLNSDSEMNAIFMAWGSGIGQGIQLGPISNLDVAPTIAALLGIELKNIAGQPLREILKDAQTH